MSGKKKIAWGQKPEAIFTEFIVGIDQWKITVNNREQSSVRRDTRREPRFGANGKVASRTAKKSYGKHRKLKSVGNSVFLINSLTQNRMRGNNMFKSKQYTYWS